VARPHATAVAHPARAYGPSAIRESTRQHLFTLLDACVSSWRRAMLIISVSFRFQLMIPEGNPRESTSLGFRFWVTVLRFRFWVRGKNRRLRSGPGKFPPLDIGSLPESNPPRCGIPESLPWPWVQRVLGGTREHSGSCLHFTRELVFRIFPWSSQFGAFLEDSEKSLCGFLVPRRTCG